MEIPVIHEAIEHHGDYISVDLAVLEYDIRLGFRNNPLHAICDLEIDSRSDIRSKSLLWLDSKEFRFVALQPYVGTLKEENFSVFSDDYVSWCGWANKDNCHKAYNDPRLNGIRGIVELLLSDDMEVDFYYLWAIQNVLYIQEDGEKPVMGSNTFKIASQRLAKVQQWYKDEQARKSAIAEKPFIYVMKAGEFYKIGVSVDPDKRRKELNTGTPFDIEIVASKRCEDAYGTESKLHERYKEFRQSGEWFKLPEDLAAEVICECSEEKVLVTV